MMELSHVLPKKKKKKSKAETILQFSLRLLPKQALATALCQTRMNACSRVLSSPRLYVRAGSSSHAAPIYIASLQAVV